MITKELFIKYIEQYQRFNSAFERIEEALMGRKYASNLYEADWVDSVGYMLDLFLKSHFTETGYDLITWWLFEDVDKIIYEKDDTTTSVKTIDELWNFMSKYRKTYFL